MREGGAEGIQQAKSTTRIRLGQKWHGLKQLGTGDRAIFEVWKSGSLSKFLSCYLTSPKPFGKSYLLRANP